MTDQPRPVFHRVISARLDQVRDTLSAVRTRFLADIGADATGRLELVLAEVMTNVAKHGTTRTAPGRAGDAAPMIHLCIVRHACGLACALTDDGDQLPPDCLLPRGLPQEIEDDMPEGGFGWYLIQTLTQELCYFREDRRNFLAFRIPALDTAPQKVS